MILQMFLFSVWLWNSALNCMNGFQIYEWILKTDLPENVENADEIVIINLGVPNAGDDGHRAGD